MDDARLGILEEAGSELVQQAPNFLGRVDKSLAVLPACPYASSWVCDSALSSARANVGQGVEADGGRTAG